MVNKHMSLLLAIRSNTLTEKLVQEEFAKYPNDDGPKICDLFISMKFDYPPKAAAAAESNMRILSTYGEEDASYQRFLQAYMLQGFGALQNPEEYPGSVQCVLEILQNICPELTSLDKFRRGMFTGGAVKERYNTLYYELLSQVVVFATFAEYQKYSDNILDVAEEAQSIKGVPEDFKNTSVGGGRINVESDSEGEEAAAGGN